VSEGLIRFRALGTGVGLSYVRKNRNIFTDFLHDDRTSSIVITCKIVENLKHLLHNIKLLHTLLATFRIQTVNSLLQKYTDS